MFRQKCCGDLRVAGGCGLEERPSAGITSPSFLSSREDGDGFRAGKCGRQNLAVDLSACFMSRLLLHARIL